MFVFYLYCFHKGFEIAYKIQYAIVKYEENENVKSNKEYIIQGREVGGGIRMGNPCKSMAD